MAEGSLSVQRACHLAGLSRSAWYNKPTDRLERDAEVIDALQALVEKHPRWGFWKYHDRLRLNGKPWNHKRTHRVYCELGLNNRRRTKKRLGDRPPQPLDVPAQPNKVWSLDFMHDTLYVGRRFRTLNVLDEGVREALAIEVDTSLPAERVVRVLDQGKPNQNAYIERFNRTFRSEVLSAYLFEDLEQVSQIAWEWMIEYNEERPHDALLWPGTSRRFNRRSRHA